VPTLLICDVEGAEAYLLDSLRVPALVSMHILVELHDFVLGGLSDVMYSRFQATHEIEHIWQEGRSRSDFPYRSFYTRCFPSYMDIAVSEGRPAECRGIGCGRSTSLERVQSCKADAEGCEAEYSVFSSLLVQPLL